MRLYAPTPRPCDVSEAYERAQRYRAALTAIFSALDLLKDRCDDDSLWDAAASMLDFAGNLAGEHNLAADRADVSEPLHVHEMLEPWRQWVEQRKASPAAALAAWRRLVVRS